VRRFVISPQIFNIIKASLMDPDMENIPTDYLNGSDFRVSKTTKGQYADYSTSKWARKESSLDEVQLAAIDTNGLHNLKDYLPTQPTADHYNAIREMFAASVDGELYDPAKWGNFYKPYGVEVPANAPAPGLQATAAPVQAQAPVAAPVAAPVVPAPVADTTIPFDVTPTAAPVVPVPEAAPAAPASTASADDILNMIRNRS
jgi:hypothetical protein